MVYRLDSDDVSVYISGVEPEEILNWARNEFGKGNYRVEKVNNFEILACKCLDIKILEWHDVHTKTE